MMTNNSDMVNMASVIPNPKRVNEEQTLNRNQPFNNITS